MPAAPRRFLPRWSTPALLGCGLAGVLIGLMFGGRFAPGKFGAIEPPLPGPGDPAEKADGGSRARNDEKNAQAVRSSALRATDAEADWLRWASQPAALARDEQMARALETLAANDPARAISLALRQTNLSLRQSLVAAALRGWAGAAPAEAARWVLQRPLPERGLAAAAVLQGAANRPDAALKVAADLIRDDPVLAHDHGCALIFGLARVGEFKAAASFAAAGAPANRTAWLDTAFTTWAEHQPEDAAAAAKAIPDTEERAAAFRAVVTGWAANDPHGLADFALNSRSDSDRRDAMRPALTEWANQDPVAVSAWINQLEPSAILDSGVAAVAIQPSLIARRPEIAVSWAESIFDPEVRIHTLAIVVGEWAKSDRAAARQYAKTSPAVSAGDRPSLLVSSSSQGDD